MRVPSGVIDAFEQSMKHSSMYRREYLTIRASSIVPAVADDWYYPMQSRCDCVISLQQSVTDRQKRSVSTLMGRVVEQAKRHWAPTVKRGELR